MRRSRFRESGSAHNTGCPRCGAPRAVEVILQARDTPGRKGSRATRSCGFCEPCAEHVFVMMETELDKARVAA